MVLGLLAVTGIYVVRNREVSLQFLEWLIPGVAFVVGVVCMAIYAWLLSAAARMPGWLASEPPVPPSP